MKNILKIVIPLIFVTGILLSCSDSTRSTTGIDGSDSTDLPIIDLRIKNSDGQALLRSVGNETYEFSYNFIEIGNGGKLGLLTEDEAKNILTFEDAPNGIKINFSKPESYDIDSFLWFELVYIDGNGNWSTRQQVDRSVFAGKRSFSWLYPLVIPGRTVKFAIQILMGDNESQTNFQIYYEVTPKHGIGIVDDLPAGYNDSNYISYDKGKVSFNNVIPPDSSTVVTKSLGFWGAEHIEKYKIWDGTSQMFDCYASNITLSKYGLPTDFYLFTERTCDKPYFFIQCGYDYTIEGFDGLNFATPRICMEPIVNDFFTLSPESRSYSNTEMKNIDSGYEVTFSGDTSLDGFFITDTTNPMHGIYFYNGKIYGVELKESGYSLLWSADIKRVAYNLKFTETGFEFFDYQEETISIYTRQQDIKSIVVSEN